MSPMAALSRVPSSRKTRSAPKRDTTALKPGVPGSRTVRARTSASMMGRWCCVERRWETVDLPGSGRQRKRIARRKPEARVARTYPRRCPLSDRRLMCSERRHKSGWFPCGAGPGFVDRDSLSMVSRCQLDGPRQPAQKIKPDRPSG
jgi:hypothetical protein